MDDRVTPQNHSVTLELSKPSSLGLDAGHVFRNHHLQSSSPMRAFLHGVGAPGCKSQWHMKFQFVHLLFPVLAILFVSSILEATPVMWIVFAEIWTSDVSITNCPMLHGVLQLRFI